MYILWVAALLGACGQHGRHLGFYQKLKFIKKRRKLKFFDVSHVKYDMIKYFAAFCVQFNLCFIHQKR